MLPLPGHDMACISMYRRWCMEKDGQISRFVTEMVIDYDMLQVGNKIMFEAGLCTTFTS